MQMFPILIGYEGTAGPCPRSIPWDVIAPYGGQAEVNHSQTLERLAERGGLSPVEAWLVMNGRTWQGVTFTKELEKQACAYLDKLVRDRQQLQADHDRYKAALEEVRRRIDEGGGRHGDWGIADFVDATLNPQSTTQEGK